MSVPRRGHASGGPSSVPRSLPRPPVGLPSLMPLAARTACTVFGCDELSPCSQHGRQAKQRATDDRRGSASSRGYGSRWRAYREGFLRRFPRCGDRPASAPTTTDSACKAQGRVTVGSVVDHIVPVYGPNDPTFYREDNHQSLCPPCHDAKRSRESRIGGGGAGKC